jgi:beta-glucanase (GH16 family)
MTVLRVFATSLFRIKPAFLTLPVCVLLLFGVFGAGAPTTYGQTLSLVWSDEFNSATSSNVDSTKWVFESGNNGGWGNGELEFYTGRTNNAYVANGLLHMRALNESTNGFHFTSVRIKTDTKFWFTYGRVEWRAKLPSGVGMWPALWMMGTNINNLGWPGCGEIDVVENNGTPTFNQGSLHNGGTISDQTAIFNFAGGDSITNFHVYDLDWTSNSISWSVDGAAFETRNNWTSSTGKPYPFPYNQPFFLLMNFATGGSYAGNPAYTSIVPVLPQEMQIDYVRVYQFVAPTAPPSTPTGLTATSTGASVSLNWNAANNATSYYVKRSLGSGGPYTTNASVTATTFTDTNVANCTTYYYVVSAVNALGEGTNSNEAAATVVGSGYLAVNSGGSAVGQFFGDTDFNGGTIATASSSPIATAGVTNPAPQAVYQTERYGPMTYTFGGLTTGASYKVRLHWAEIYFTAANSRKFNVSINGTQVLTNFDIFAASGGMNMATIREYTVTPVGNQIVVAYATGTADLPKASGTEIILLPPVAPANLTATGGVAQIILNWSAVPGVSSYNVKRSLSNGGPYTNVISGVATTNYTDTGLASATTYYYVVSAVLGVCNEGTNSAQATATTAASALSYSQWQLQYFTCTNCPQADPAFDADGTGQNNQFKFVAGLDPTNPASVFVLGIASVTGQPTQVNLIFNPVASGRTYTPQFTTDTVSGVWTQLTGYAGPVIIGNQGTITDLNAVLSNEYYRIDISAPTSP